MKLIKLCFFCILFFSQLSTTFGNAVLVHNSRQEIENCKEKLQLKLIRVWGGDEEEDENKFFKIPMDIAVDKNRNIYICDWGQHRIQVFDYSGKFLRTIGRKGQGPGDLFCPKSIKIDEDGNLIVCENLGLRIQILSPTGKYLKSFKLKYFSSEIFSLSSKEVAIYSHMRTFDTRKLLFIYDYKGSVKSEIGKYHDNTKSRNWSELIRFAVDSKDYFFAANVETPVIRKYSQDGRLLLVITYDMPAEFEKVPEVTLNSDRNEIEIKREKRWSKEKRSGYGIQTTGSRKIILAKGISVDSKNRIFLVAKARKMTEKEYKNSYASGFVGGVDRKGQDISLFENIDLLKLLVFSPSGKVIASVRLNSLCDKLYIYNNRLFIVDGYKTQRILEYEMIFKE